MKTFFMNDYGEGAHPLVMRRLMETNMEHTCGYGLDEYSLRAADVIREKCGQPGAAVHIMTGGTSANSIAIAAFLRRMRRLSARRRDISTCMRPARWKRRGIRCCPARRRTVR